MAVKWGILSTANINQSILAGAAKSDVAKVVAVASRSQANADAYARKHGIARAYGSYDALLADKEIDAVFISLPNSMHTEWSLKALAAGKHVLCEKPMTRHAADVPRIFDAAKKANRIVMEGLMYRHHPQTVRTKQLVDEGAIGRLLFVRAALSFMLQGPNVRLSRELEGGSVMDLGCYCLSSMRLLAGEPEAVVGSQIVTVDGVDTRFFATLFFPNDVVGQFDVAMTMPLRGQLEIVGDAGSIFIGDPWVCANPGIELRRDGKVEKIAIDAVDHYGLELDNMSRAIEGREAPLLGRDDALGQARGVEALYASVAAGRKFALSELKS